MPTLESAAPGEDGGVTLGGLVREVAVRLKAAGVDEASVESRRIVAHAAGVAPLEIVSRPERKLLPAVADEARRLAGRRERHEPLSRILGEREFYGRAFWLSPGTLDPRPETELLVERALAVVAGRPGEIRLLDAGTGTGAIAISLLAELPGATALAIDLSEDALATAGRNAVRHGVADRLRLARRDMLDPNWLAREAPFDLILSNPPYIPSGEIDGLHAAVRLFDPVLALDGGSDGLDAYRALRNYLPYVATGGALIVEVGAGQVGDVAAILVQGRPDLCAETTKDLSGHSRIVAIR